MSPHTSPADPGAADNHLDELVHRADLDGLVRMIDDRCSTRDWPGLLRVRDRARHAVETGRQLWPAATLAEYRLALIGPPEFVAAVLDESDGLSGRFTIGPLTEVAAQHHTWAELAPVLDRGPRAAFVAHERVIRGEHIGGETDAEIPPVLEIPTTLADWEPAYAVATYAENGAEFPPPQLPDPVWTHVDGAGDAEQLDDPDVELAVRQLVEPWTVSSNGRLDTICVAGGVAEALATLGVRRARVEEIDAAAAISCLAWAGSSGGAHGRRRGAAAGRFGAWWLLGALGDLLDDWPPPPDLVGDVATAMRWWRWDAHEPEVGWRLQLAVEDQGEGVAWVVNAADAI